MKIVKNKNWFMFGPEFYFTAETQEEEYLLNDRSKGKVLADLLTSLGKEVYGCLNWEGIPDKFHSIITKKIREEKEKIDMDYKENSDKIWRKYKKIKDDKKALELAEKEALEEKEKIKQAVREVLDEREKDANSKPEGDSLSDFMLEELEAKE